MKASAWKWMAIAFIVLFAITASFAALFYYDYNATMSSLIANENAGASSVGLENTQTLVNDQTVSVPPGSAHTFNFNLPYAGYIEVIVSSTSPNTYVQITGEYYLPNSPNTGWTYNSGDLPVGTSGTVYFPVVPGQVTVSIGNANANSGATATVTIIYYS
ncbi:MAG: hypothetical protein RXP86_11625 [Acidilobus sp.]